MQKSFLGNYLDLNVQESLTFWFHSPKWVSKAIGNGYDYLTTRTRVLNGCQIGIDPDEPSE